MVLNWDARETDLDLWITEIDPANKKVACRVWYSHKDCNAVKLDTDVRVSVVGGLLKRFNLKSGGETER